jgi:predicted negative regulator of RcsB-dependent stress response
MKAQRRHALKENSLSRQMERLPDLAQRYGNRVLLGITLILLAIIVVRYRANEAAENEQTASRSLSEAETAINDLWNSPLTALGDQGRMAALRDDYVHDADGQIDDTLRWSDDSKIRAEAYVARGHLNWILANYPELPAAARQPGLALKKSSDEYLTAAEAAYSEVLKDPLAKNHHALTAARLGLAAIAEDRKDWDAADKYYQEVSGDPATSAAFKTYATARDAQLAELKRPILVASSDETPPAPEPTTVPSVLSPLPPLSLQPYGPELPTTAPSK